MAEDVIGKNVSFAGGYACLRADVEPVDEGFVAARLVTADEWDAITARLARLDAIEAAWEQWRTGTPGQVSMSSLFDALDGKP